MCGKTNGITAHHSLPRARENTPPPPKQNSMDPTIASAPSPPSSSIRKKLVQRPINRQYTATISCHLYPKKGPLRCDVETGHMHLPRTHDRHCKRLGGGLALCTSGCYRLPARPVRLSYIRLLTPPPPGGNSSPALHGAKTRSVPLA